MRLNLLILLTFFVLSSCASKPVLYPNKKYQSVGKEQAKADIEQEKQSALVTLRKEVANLAIQSATMILDAELDAEKNQKLVDNYINDLTKN